MRLWCGRNRGSHEKAGASEMRPYQVGATDVHPALSSPSATPLRSGGYAARLSEPTERRRAQMLRRKTRLLEGEARDEGASAELSDMRRRGSSDARRDTSQGEKPVSRRRSIAARIAAKTTGAAAQGAGVRPSHRAPRRTPEGAKRGFVSGRLTAEKRVAF